MISSKELKFINIDWGADRSRFIAAGFISNNPAFRFLASEQQIQGRG